MRDAFWWTRNGNNARVILSRNWSLFLVAAGAFNWLIWPRFALAIWDDQRAWSGEIGQSTPTAFLLVHAVLIVHGGHHRHHHPGARCPRFPGRPPVDARATAGRDDGRPRLTVATVANSADAGAAANPSVRVLRRPEPLLSALLAQPVEGADLTPGRAGARASATVLGLECFQVLQRSAHRRRVGSTDRVSPASCRALAGNA